MKSIEKQRNEVKNFTLSRRKEVQKRLNRSASQNKKLTQKDKEREREKESKTLELVDALSQITINSNPTKEWGFMEMGPNILKCKHGETFWYKGEEFQHMPSVEATQNNQACGISKFNYRKIYLNVDHLDDVTYNSFKD